MPRLFERVTIAGVGLIGGSLALAGRAAGLIGEVVGYGRSEANLRVAQTRGIVDRYALTAPAAAQDADLLVLAVPVRAMAAVAGACAPVLRPDAIVTDVGSVKQAVLEALTAVLPAGMPFVGAHPIAGTEVSGAAAAFPELFRGRRCIITPSAGGDATAVAKIRALWEGVGMRVDEMDAARHDTILAWVSHLPHAVAFSVLNALLDVDPTMLPFAGPSFRDLTRVAASSVEMWGDIFFANAERVDAAVARCIDALGDLRQIIAHGDAAGLAAFLARAQAARRQLNQQERDA